MRDQPGLRQSGIEIGHWDTVVRHRSREVSTLKTENLTPAKRFSDPRSVSLSNELVEANGSRYSKTDGVAAKRRQTFHFRNQKGVIRNQIRSNAARKN